MSVAEQLNGATVVLSISGGKDSTAASLYLTELGIEHRRVFADTQWEAHETYEHLDYLRTVLGAIDVVRGELGFADLVLQRGIFPRSGKQFCTAELKGKPLDNYIVAIAGRRVSVVGIRGGESVARAKLPEWEYRDSSACEVWRPLIAWSEQDVIDIHVRHGVHPHPHYMVPGVNRVGCWPCINSRKAQIAHTARVSPDRIDLIRKLEGELLSRFAARHDGATHESLGMKPARMFCRQQPGVDGWIPVAIDEVVSWAQTARGGRQLTLCDIDEPGCVRWGMCEPVRNER